VLAAHPIDLLAYTHAHLRTEAEAMHDNAVHDETNAESEPDQPAGGLPGSLVDAQVRTRSQADLVRESLVRCPGAGGEPVPR
jgi:hypothetical protein